MTPSIRIDSLGVDVPVEHPRRRGPAEVGSIHVQVHDNGFLVWDEWCQLCSDVFSFDPKTHPLISQHLGEMPHLDATYRVVADFYIANRTNLVGAHLDHAVRAMESAIAERDGSSVYFAYTGGHVKIGYSKRVSARLAQLQTGCATPIQLVGTMPGGRAVERRVHAQFDHLRLDGEWFIAHPDLMAHIAEVAR